MKQVKQIIEFILVVASCFFRKRKQQKVHPHVPEDPYPPGSCNGRKGDCPGCSGCDNIYNEGYYIYGWDLEWAYEKNGKPILTPQEIYNSMEKIYEKKLSSKEDKVVLLMHDFMFSNNFDGKENLKTLIQLLKNGGWSFENIENY
jgi:hypothetical protein